MTDGYGQVSQDFYKQVDELLEGKQVSLGYYIQSDDTTTNFFRNPNEHFPMQSVFKTHIALFMLDQIQRGRFKLHL
ncbi:MAG TPA: hypothetical protein PKD85_22335 [Saprospiraceae bacterium]|nr:hypothetical protein [Saprospiraceae bacterium]